MKLGLYNLLVPTEAKPYISNLPMKRIVDHLVMPGDAFGGKSLAERDLFLLKSLENAVNNLEKKLGKNIEKWQYGQENYKHILLYHPLSPAVKKEIRDKLEVGPLPRGGNGYTVGSTGNNENQSSGASFRIIVDTKDWDQAVAMNSPGQSGDPDSKHYEDLFSFWAKDQFFPLVYSKEKVNKKTERVILLNPSK